MSRDVAQIGVDQVPIGPGRGIGRDAAALSGGEEGDAEKRQADRAAAMMIDSGNRGLAIRGEYRTVRIATGLAAFLSARQGLRPSPGGLKIQRMKRCAIAFAAACLAALAVSADLSAQKNVVLQVGEQPPLFSPSGGIVDRVIVAALAAEGYRAELEWLPIGRMLALLKEDGLERYITASNTPGQQNPRLDFLEARGVFFYKKSRFPGFDPKRLEDLKGRTVATVVNSPNTPLFRSAGIVVDEGSNETWFEKLDLERVDFTATADVGGILTIRELFPGRESEFAFTELSYASISAGLYAKSDPELLASAKRGFAKIKADGSLEKMLKEFFGPENWRRVRVR